jgi:hypothetical protein
MPLFVNIKNPLLAENYNIVSQFPKYITKDEHMPAQHQLYRGINERDGDYYRRWASSIGQDIHTRRVGLDRETNKELLLKNIHDKGDEGAPFKELQQVLPGHNRGQSNTSTVAGAS